jgi:hypothetical protein
MTLNELIPSTPSFKLNGKTYTLRLLNLEDIAYFEERYGSIQKLIEILGKDGDYKNKCEIIYSQLIEKEDFMETEIDEINRLGKKEKRMLTGAEMFLRSIGLKHLYEPINAFLDAVSKSTPLPREDDKKKVEPASQSGS